MPRSTVLLCLCLATTFARAEDEPASQRVPWTTSRIVGSPEPPPPYVTERIWPKLAFQQPVEMVVAPGEARPYVVERKGRILRLPADRTSDATEVVMEGAKEIAGLTATYGLAFHPNFEENRLCYVCYILKPELPNGTRVSRFRMTEPQEGRPARIDVSSETILLEWKSGGHNGGSLKFGPDGFLYVSTGDAAAPSPPDGLDTGQDVSDLLASILRIDVDREENGKPYAIPDDNPFVDLDGARPEVWAYGLRNPWRMSFDRKTGDLWLGDVGWQLWETVHRVERGGNYGWSVKEGPQQVRPTAMHGPTPVLPAVKSLPRSEAASVTGGFVYHGDRLPDLRGTYVYGDYVTGKIWSLSHDDGELTAHRELTDTRAAVICFFEDHDGEIAFLDYNAGTVHRLVPNESAGQPSDFPRKLSETGLFADVPKGKPADGVYPFEVNVARWMDGAKAERLVAIPGHGTMTLREPTERVPRNWGKFPENTVLAKTISVEHGDERRKLETQILHYNAEDWRGNSGEWIGYTYVWNDEQTDATLAPAEGRDLTVEFGDRTLRWHVASRAECYACHNPWSGYRLGFTIPQLNREVRGHEQLDSLEQDLRLVSLEEPKNDSAKWPPAFPSWDEGGPALHVAGTRDDAAAVRAYLHVNCAHCHRFGGGGTATIQLRYDLELERTGLVNGRATQGTFGIDGAGIVVPEDPARSLLLYRMGKTGRGRMPHIGSQEVDSAALLRVAGWIAALDRDDESAADPQSGLKDVLRLHDLRLSENERQKVERTLLGSTRTAHATALSLWGAPPATRPTSIVARASADPRPEIRDLFEPFLPPEKRIQRLGTSVAPETILAKSGDVEAGRRLFLESKTLQCRQCHRGGDEGGRVGPDLLGIGKRSKPREILTAILEPSASIDPKWRAYVVETKKGRVHSGLLVERGENGVVVRGADGKDVRIAASDVEEVTPQARSLMPDLQFRDMTAAELADLLAYLVSLDEEPDAPAGAGKPSVPR